MRRYLKFIAKRVLPWYRVNWLGKGTLNFVDIGSIGGLPVPWDRMAWHVRHLLNFEPNDTPRRTAHVTTYNTAVWDSECERDFYIYESPRGVGSSLFRQNVDFVRANFEELSKRGDPAMAATWFDRARLARTLRVRCRTLDQVAKDEFPEVRFHFLKVDAQGAEGQIIRGAPKTVGGCDGVLLELFTIPLYEEIMLMPEVVQLMEACGHQLVKVFPAHGTFASQHDCLFLRRDADLTVRTMLERIYGLRSGANPGGIESDH